MPPVRKREPYPATADVTDCLPKPLLSARILIDQPAPTVTRFVDGGFLFLPHLLLRASAWSRQRRARTSLSLALQFCPSRDASCESGVLVFLDRVFVVHQPRVHEQTKTLFWRNTTWKRKTPPQSQKTAEIIGAARPEKTNDGKYVESVGQSHDKAENGRGDLSESASHSKTLPARSLPKPAQ